MKKKQMVLAVVLTLSLALVFTACGGGSKSSSGSGGGFAITYEHHDGGSFSGGPSSEVADKRVTLTVNTNSGWTFVPNSVKVASDWGEEDVTAVANSNPPRYWFIMPDSDVTVTAEWTRNPADSLVIDNFEWTNKAFPMYPMPGNDGQYWGKDGEGTDFDDFATMLPVGPRSGFWIATADGQVLDNTYKHGTSTYVACVWNAVANAQVGRIFADDVRNTSVFDGDINGYDAVTVLIYKVGRDNNNPINWQGAHYRLTLSDGAQGGQSIDIDIEPTVADAWVRFEAPIPGGMTHIASYTFTVITGAAGDVAFDDILAVKY